MPGNRCSYLKALAPMIAVLSRCRTLRQKLPTRCTRCLERFTKRKLRNNCRERYAKRVSLNNSYERSAKSSWDLARRSLCRSFVGIMSRRSLRRSIVVILATLVRVAANSAAIICRLSLRLLRGSRTAKLRAEIARSLRATRVENCLTKASQ